MLSVMFVWSRRRVWTRTKKNDLRQRKKRSFLKVKYNCQL